MPTGGEREDADQRTTDENEKAHGQREDSSASAVARRDLQNKTKRRDQDPADEAPDPLPSLETIAGHASVTRRARRDRRGDGVHFCSPVETHPRKRSHQRRA
jgi:hypothetical protein